eukprot:Platyproteum_vivax@DN16562_c0_g1_i1.p1
MALNSKFEAMTGSYAAFPVDPEKPTAICSQFMASCNENGGPPHCFSAFCDQQAECIDCPTASLDQAGEGNYSLEVCGDRGTCKLGWKDPYNEGGNGYCVCEAPWRGLTCTEK